MRPWIVALLVVAGCNHPANIDAPAPASLAERFELVAFFNEFDAAEAPLRRWAGPISVLLGDENAEPYREHARVVLADLDRLTPIPVSLVRDNLEPNMIVLVGTWREIEAFRSTVPGLSTSNAPRRFTCLGRGFMDNASPAGVIAATAIMVDATLEADHIRRCLAQEMTQALGLPNDIDDPDGTVFSSNSRRETLSATDEQIVRILYDPRLRPGMTRAEAMPIVRVIAAELEAEQAAGR